MHRQVYLVLRGEIQQGIRQNGETLPSEDELAARFGVSRVTIRTSLAALEADGLIERQQGKGTFVRNSVSVEPLQSSMSDLLAHMRDVSNTTEVTVHEFDYVNPPPALGLGGSNKIGMVQRAVRVRSRAGKPLFHITTFIPEEIGRSFSRQDLGAKPLQQLLQRAKVTVHSGEQVVTATVADPTVAARLGLAIGEPLIVVRRKYFDRVGKLVEYLEMLASPSVFELQTALTPSEL
ncbi:MULTISPECIES: GntR family transcriptional regulator [unclassified Bradyrhizobium]|uniref:GntR family transcriptional regulator n=1 Tax=unclassified Bradyrhizobium TaxID=2631580 RepID=UPI0024E113B5|nr:MULTISPECIES: GntR family transcriptional regulator [unclassified Bradyrhizobium]